MWVDGSFASFDVSSVPFCGCWLVWLFRQPRCLKCSFFLCFFWFRLPPSLPPTVWWIDGACFCLIATRAPVRAWRRRPVSWPSPPPPPSSPPPASACPESSTRWSVRPLMPSVDAVQESSSTACCVCVARSCLSAAATPCADGLLDECPLLYWSISLSLCSKLSVSSLFCPWTRPRFRAEVQVESKHIHTCARSLGNG